MSLKSDRKNRELHYTIENIVDNEVFNLYLLYIRGINICFYKKPFDKLLE
jgi:hypothetical protein